MVSVGSTGALDGIRVADFTRVLAGPYASMYLGDLGADVIKVEPPEGDETRAWTPPRDARGESAYFASVNRNKRAVRLELRDADDLAYARELALGADVVLENFRPGVMERFGLGYEQLAAESPGLVYGSVTGFGRDSELPGYDFLVQGLSGLMSITGSPDGEPTKVGVAVVDVLTGLNLVTGVLAALHERGRSGRGQRVEVSLLGSALAGLVNVAGSALATGEAPGRRGNAHPSICPYEAFPAADGQLLVAVGNDHQFAALAEELGTPELARDARFADNDARVRNREALVPLLAGLFAARGVDDWVRALAARRVPAGRCNTVPEAIALAASLGLDPVVELPDAGGVARSIAHPVRYSRTPAAYRLAPPAGPGARADATPERPRWTTPKETR